MTYIDINAAIAECRRLIEKEELDRDYVRQRRIQNEKSQVAILSTIPKNNHKLWKQCTDMIKISSKAELELIENHTKSIKVLEETIIGYENIFSQ